MKAKKASWETVSPLVRGFWDSGKEVQRLEIRLESSHLDRHKGFVVLELHRVKVTSNRCSWNLGAMAEPPFRCTFLRYVDGYQGCIQQLYAQRTLSGVDPLCQGGVQRVNGRESALQLHPRLWTRSSISKHYRYRPEPLSSPALRSGHQSSMWLTESLVPQLMNNMTQGTLPSLVRVNQNAGLRDDWQATSASIGW